MINTKFTNAARRVLGIEGEVRFPQGCLLCGAENALPVLINQTKSSVLAGSISTQTNTFPLCQSCTNHHYQKIGRLNLYITLLFLTGVLGCFSLGLIGEKIGGIDNPLVAFGIIPFAVAVVASAILMKVKNSSFPVTMRVTTESFLNQKLVLVFTFKHAEIFLRMHEANDIASASSR